MPIETTHLRDCSREKVKWAYKGWRIISNCVFCGKRVLDKKQVEMTGNYFAEKRLVKGLDRILGRTARFLHTVVANKKKAAEAFGYREIVYPVCVNCAKEHTLDEMDKHSLVDFFNRTDVYYYADFDREKPLKEQTPHMNQKRKKSKIYYSRLKNYLKSLELFRESVKLHNYEESEFLEGLIAILSGQDTKIFEIDKDINLMLENTRNYVKPVHLPFTSIFIEAEIHHKPFTRVSDNKTVIWNKPFYGLLLVQGPDLEVRFSTITVGKDKEYQEHVIWFSNLLDSTRDPKTDEQHRASSHALRHIRNYIINFVDFLNDPEVIVQDITKQERTRRKWLRKRGIKLPRINKVVKVTGKLKIYLREVQRYAEKFHYSHRFWVRGHWRRFRHERFTNMRGRKIWIPPYIKGSGILIPKRYKLVRNIR